MGDRCYCVFEGGGAKGIAHVGALAALERSDLELAGFAGTSAGAIVASLAAAGYTSDEMFGDHGSILDRIDLDPANVSDGVPRRPVGTPRRLLGSMAWLGIQTSQLAFMVGPPLIVLLLFFSSGFIHWLGLIGEGVEFAIQLTLVLLLVASPFYIASPVASLRRVRDSINQAIALKITGVRYPEYVQRGSRRMVVGPEGITFAHLTWAKRPPLKIVATDISNRRLALFSAESTPKVSIGDAVAASICLPGIFRPWKVNAALHYDGGLVSNLPAWAFDAERALDRDAWTAVVEVSDKKGPASLPRGVGVLSATLNTALFGSSSLDTRGVDRLRSAPLAVDLGLLQFGMSRDQAQRVVREARDTCLAVLVYQLEVLPRQIELACAQVVKDCRILIDVVREEEGRDKLKGTVRLGLLFPLKGETGTLINEFSSGYAKHPDERIRLPLESSLAGWALNGNKKLNLAPKKPVYADRDDPELWNSALSRQQDRWARKLLWKRSQWVLYVPYYHAPNDVWLVAMLDADHRLEVTNLSTTLTFLVEQIETVLKVSLPQEAFKWL